MNRNVESHFSQLPSIDIERSIFDRSFGHKLSGNVGDLIPFFWDEVLPGDTFNVTTSLVARLQTLLTPIMDNVYMDTYFFFVPSRLTWIHWKEFMGENTESAWIPETQYSVPKISSPENGWVTGSIADYMGIPVGVEFSSESGLMPQSLPLRAYALICQEWFRDQNLSDPLNIPLGDSNQEGSNGDNYITDVVNGGMPFKVAKYHDLFTSCLPSPQKGPAVTFGADPIAIGSLPVFAGDNHNSSTRPLHFGYRNGEVEQTLSGSHDIFAYGQAAKVNTASLGSGISSYDVTPINLYADGSKLDVSGVSFTINELRLAFQLQKFYERSARGGSRYREILKSFFNVTSPDARMMIPEYLGGHRFPIQIHQVTNNSESESAFLGDLGAMSNTSDVHEDFVKSFTEHGFVFGLCCLRYDHSYPQGLSREWTRDSMLDYYFPVFANIGEQPRYVYEIDATVRENENRNDVFGYNEAWAEYRYKPNRVSGEMRPGIQNSLASWHLADYYTSAPRLSDEWIREDKTNVDRVLAVTSLVSNQFFADFYVKNIVTRAMPMYSIPGLIDHH